MKVFSDKVQVKKKNDNYILSIAVNDNTLIISELTDKEIRILRRDIEKLLNEEK